MRISKKKSLSELVNHSLVRTTLFVFFMTTAISIVVLFWGIFNNAKENLARETELAAGRISWSLRYYKNVVESIGKRSELADPSLPISEKVAILRDECRINGFLRAQILNLNGTSLMDSNFRGEREYFQVAKTGLSYISEPIYAKSDGDLTVIVAAPIWRDGVAGSEVVSVVWCALEPSILDTIMKGIQLTKHGEAYLLSNKGYTVTSTNPDVVVTMNNNIIRSETEKDLRRIAEIERKMLHGEKGVELVPGNRRVNFYSYHPVDETNGWSLVIHYPARDVMDWFYTLIFFFLCFVIVTCILITVIYPRVSFKISEPVRHLAERLQKAAVGDLTSAIIDFGDSEETKIISDSLRDIVSRLDLVVNSNEEFKNNIMLGELIDTSAIENICDFYANSNVAGLMLRICDSAGTFIAGNRNADIERAIVMGPNKSVESIMLEGRIIGSIEAELKADATITKEQAIIITETVAGLLSRMVYLNFRQNLKFHGQMEKIQSGMDVFITMNKKLVEKFRQGLESIDDVLSKDDLILYRKLIEEIAQDTASTLSSVDETVDFAMMTGLNAEISEEIYSVQTLIALVHEDVDLVLEKENVHFEVDVAEGIPVKLLGDVHNISRVISRLILNGEENLYGDTIVMSIISMKRNYSNYLEIRLFYRNYVMKQDEITRINMYLQNSSASKNFSTETYKSNVLRFVSAARLVKQMSGTVEIDMDKNFGTTLTISLPQLEVND